MSRKIDLQFLEDLYTKYNKKEYITLDPLEFVWHYNNLNDQEIVGLIASSLAYGNVKQILKSIKRVLLPMGHSPYQFLKSTSKAELKKIYKNFKHRFTTDDELIQFLWNLKEAVMEYGSLGNFVKKISHCCHDLLGIQEKLVYKLKGNTTNIRTLLPEIKKGSACKRLNLFFRWMVRKDEVDPGCWHGILPKDRLIIPLDTHIYDFSIKFGLTTRKTKDLKTAIEITKEFTKYNPQDPVKYDFAITRSGIAKIYNIYCYLD